MASATLAPVQASKSKAEPARMPAMKSHRPAAIPSITNFLSAVGNMAIQRAASGPLGGNPAAAAILGGANMSGNGCTCSTGSCEECKKKPMQRKSEGDSSAPSHEFHSALSRSGSGAPLASHTRTMMKQRFGQSFDDVRIHSDGAAADAARDIHAHAFTTGRDIYFGQGRYEPHTIGGQKLLAHELTHVLQQRQGVVQPGLKSLNATAHDDVFEREAEQVERQFDRHEHSVAAAIRETQKNGHGHSAPSGGRSVQKKCACGGTCSACSGQPDPHVTQEIKKPAIQRKAEESPATRDKTRRLQQEGPEQSGASRTIQRKCACGGTCSKCSGQSEEPSATTTELKKSPLQRKAEDLPASKATPAQSQKKEAAAQPSLQEQTIQRKCACGGTCSKCSDENNGMVPQELRKLPVQAKPDDKLPAPPTPATPPKPATPLKPEETEAACVKENLDEENLESQHSPGQVTLRKSPSPTALSFWNYANDGDTPKPEHLVYLSLLRPLLAKSGMGVKIVGRASCPAAASYNWGLSRRRAETFAKLLKPLLSHVDVDWLGESQPVADNLTPDGRSRNRTVDLIPLSPPIPPFSFCEMFPAFCPPPPPRKFCEKHPELCEVPNFCDLFPWICEHCPDDDCDEDHRTFCEKHPIICSLLPSCLDHPIICACLLAPELCLLCLEDPALCLSSLECLINPSKCIPKPPKPPTTPKRVLVIFTDVRAANTPDEANDRISDDESTGVLAIVIGWQPPMPPIRISVAGANRVNGDALINGAKEISITGTTFIEVQGIYQTAPAAPVLPLTLQATMAGAPVGESNHFAVADLMENVEISLKEISMTNPSGLEVLLGLARGVRIVDRGPRVGMRSQMTWESDGIRGVLSLDELIFFEMFRERTSTGSWLPLRDIGGLGQGNKGYFFVVEENLPLTIPGRRETELVWVFHDRRSHSTAAVTNSGYKIEEVVEPDPHRSGSLQLRLSQTGDGVNVHGFRSDAGGGTAQATIPLENEPVCGSPQLPDTVVNWTGTDRGEIMTANPLTRCGPHGSSHSNSTMTLPGWGCIAATPGANAFWVHAHLLHGKTGSPDLHGPGNDPRNLILTDKSINGQMSSKVEGTIRDELAIGRISPPRDQTLSYRVRALHVANNGDKRYFADGMEIALNRIDPVTRTTTETIFNDTIRSDTHTPVPLICT